MNVVGEFVKTEKVKLKDIGKIVTGCTPKTKKEEYYNNKEYMFVGPSDIKINMYVKKTEKYISSIAYRDYSSRFIEENSIMVDCIGSDMGNVALSCEKLLTNQQINSITQIDEKRFNVEYIYYVLMTMKKYFHLIGTNGSTMPIINKSMFEEIEIEVPEKNIQDKIAKVLSDINKKIELNNQINDNLYNICNVIFHNYIDKYSEQIKYTKIIDIADRVVTGKTPTTKNEEFWNGDIPFITIPDMHNQVFTIDTERKISKAGAKSLIPKNSISVSCIATVGLVSISTEESQTNQQINSIILKNDYDLYYLFEFLSEQENFMKNIAGGSTTYNINKTTFENIEVPYLPQNIVQEFHDMVCKLFDKIKLNQIENKNLEKMRDTLLPKLMNGEIDIDKIEI